MHDGCGLFCLASWVDCLIARNSVSFLTIVLLVVDRVVELKKQSSCSLELINKTDQYLAFKHKRCLATDGQRLQRTDNAVKNRFSTLCKKRAKFEASSKENSVPSLDPSNKRVLVEEPSIAILIGEPSTSNKQMGYHISPLKETIEAHRRSLGEHGPAQHLQRPPLLEDNGAPINGVAEYERPKKVLILMSDTGGGHRASMEAIRAAFNQEFDDEYQVFVTDLWTEHTPWPFNQLPRSYNFLVKHGALWKMAYYGTAPRLVLSIQQLYKISTMYWDDKYGMQSVTSEFTNLKYSRVEIDEVRIEWAEYMLDYI
ncbi:hypothetical protein ZIOFF_009717 [Zingiber officinale]|uniref:Diacylglycerol glucosyltransferase N-terminal domain-containing protein n=1 Tax=Zingiber officinale TaxID=94328 RepID=A0A8J5HL99_ZINOF|nr:hypothetical protein ZIOFF_009717 [Zingiber officinale]